MPDNDTLFFWRVKDGTLCIGITPKGFSYLRQGRLIWGSLNGAIFTDIQFELMKKKNVPMAEQEAEQTKG
jgi:hypothetical protein